MDSAFLVAIALIEGDGRRAVPLGGRSCAIDANSGASPGEPAIRIALELLLRLFQSSDTVICR
ncbi:MAG: hypothetical protein VKI42_00050 [Synechococcaceae cyanobacterium]|nr:hypothetical protein [Synechococcaceae cyanobacterium]